LGLGSLVCLMRFIFCSRPTHFATNWRLERLDVDEIVSVHHLCNRLEAADVDEIEVFMTDPSCTQ
jgi:hypothetical protein